MEPLVLTNWEEINRLLAEVALRGGGFTTECLLDSVMEAGISAPDYLKATGADPNAFYQGAPGAWGSYHIREGKKVFLIFGGDTGARRSHVSDTP